MRDSSYWSAVATRVLNVYAIAIFAVLWVGLVVALVVNPGWLDSLWSWVRGLPTVAEVIVWVLLLPIMVGLWIWESSWALILRVLGFAGIVGWTLVAVYNFMRTMR